MCHSESQLFAAVSTEESPVAGGAGRIHGTPWLHLSGENVAPNTGTALSSPVSVFLLTRGWEGAVFGIVVIVAFFPFLWATGVRSVSGPFTIGQSVWSNSSMARRWEGESLRGPI